jgi:hypothetical protein
MNECALNGYLMGPKGEMLWEPGDNMWGVRKPTVGCDRLRCAVCGAMVRNHAGWVVDDEQVKFGTAEYRARVDALYESATWDGLPYAARHERYRTYVCRCGVVLEDWERALGASNVGGFGTSPIPWSCVGHPEVTLPFTMDGVTFRTEDELASIRNASGDGDREADRRLFDGRRPECAQGRVALPK